VSVKENSLLNPVGSYESGGLATSSNGRATGCEMNVIHWSASVPEIFPTTKKRPPTMIASALHVSLVGRDKYLLKNCTSQADN
jgi:hypothetical protein